MNSLKPCPFCGNDLQRQNEIDPEDTIYPIDREHTLWNLICNFSHGGCDVAMLGHSIDDCITKWNRRHD